MVVPTLAADEALDACLESLERQTWRDFEVVIVDNSGANKVGRRPPARVITNPRNLGFGAAINQAVHETASDYVATLNDDAVAEPGWLGELVEAIEGRPDVGMCAACVRLGNGSRMDSAGMLLCADGVAKQRGHLRSPAEFRQLEEVLLPSGSSALYRRRMLDEIGLFDEDFFLYCEDTDLGLRARWAGWKCIYVPKARVDHRYSHSAGRASPLKAYYVERNRLYLVWKNFPLGMIPVAALTAMQRYFWHAVAAFNGEGVTGAYQKDGGGIAHGAWIIVKAHLASFRALLSLLRKRRSIQAKARITAREFRELARQHSISAREVASL